MFKSVNQKNLIIIVLATLLILSLVLLVFVYVTPEKARPLSKAKPQATAIVSKGTVSSTVELPGTIESQSKTEVPIPIPGGSKGVITHVYVNPGENANFCQPLVEISGRPVFALVGDFNLYRNIAQGDRGRDVFQLQRALQQCGYQVSADGEAGIHTATAVRRMYRRSGYDAPKTDEGTNSVDEGAGGQGANASDKKSKWEEARAADEPVLLSQSEVIFLPAAARLLSNLSVGAEVGGDTKLQFASGKKVVKLELTATQISKLEPGMKVTLKAGQWLAETVVSALPDTPEKAKDGQDDAEPHFLLRLPAPGAPDEQNIQCSFTKGSEKIYPLTVPQVAVHFEGDKTFVFVRAKEGTKKVPVQVEQSGDGQVAVRGHLKVGQKVLLDVDPK
ncbi:MAG: efflux RND transporter periplasmic adaptor subunit [Actinomycetaceae bacterium]|nr:efflux RND transporter periplasmic adaptor subunit [Actinomycetaceae bacterium]